MAEVTTFFRNCKHDRLNYGRGNVVQLQLSSASRRLSHKNSPRSTFSLYGQFEVNLLDLKRPTSTTANVVRSTVGLHVVTQGGVGRTHRACHAKPTAPLSSSPFRLYLSVTPGVSPFRFSIKNLRQSTVESVLFFLKEKFLFLFSPSLPVNLFLSGKKGAKSLYACSIIQTFNVKFLPRNEGKVIICLE